MWILKTFSIEVVECYGAFFREFNPKFWKLHKLWKQFNFGLKTIARLYTVLQIWCTAIFAIKLKLLPRCIKTRWHWTWLQVEGNWIWPIVYLSLKGPDLGLYELLETCLAFQARLTSWQILILSLWILSPIFLLHICSQVEIKCANCLRNEEFAILGPNCTMNWMKIAFRCKSFGESFPVSKLMSFK